MHTDQHLTSADGRHKLVMQADGNMVLSTPGSVIRASDTGGNPGAWAVMQSDGNFVIYSASHVPLWSTGPQGAGAAVGLQPDGNLVVHSSSGGALWAWGTYSDRLTPGDYLKQGQYIQSANGKYRLWLQADSNVVLYGPDGPRWNLGSLGSGGTTLVLQASDGNVVLYTASSHPVWDIGAVGPNAGFVVQNDGNLVQYDGSGNPHWQSHTSNAPPPPPPPSPPDPHTQKYPYDSAVCLDTGQVTGFCKSSTWKINGSDLSPDFGYGYRNCTDYVAWWLVQEGAPLNSVTGAGNAVAWVGHFARDSGPHVGDIAWWGSKPTNPFGHVAIVTGVNPDGSVSVAQYNRMLAGEPSTESRVVAEAYLLP